MSSVIRRLKGLIPVLALIAALVITGFAGSIKASAAVDYYATWDDYVAAGGATETWNDKANAIDAVVEACITMYRQGDQDGAYQAALAIYNFYYETSGFERKVNGYSGAEVSKAELQFKTCRKAVKKGQPEDEVVNNFIELSTILHTQANYLDGIDEPGVSGLNLDGSAEADTNTDSQQSSDTESKTGTSSTTATTPKSTGRSSEMLTFLSCFGIILREGLEAILVVGAIIAYLVKSGNKDKLKAVYLGCILAIGASFLSAWLLEVLKFANTENQEIIEGVTALIAVIVLFYVSNWMVSKAEAEAWTKYIDDQVKVSAETGSVFTLGFTAFLAVFREGAEVILFYQPLINEEGSGKYVWGGFGLGCVVLVFVFLAIRFLSVKLPIRPFFLGTSILMFIMSVSFLGSGIKELIEGDVIDMTSPEWLQELIPFNDTLDVLGIYPVLQTLIPQLILILITVMIFVIQKWKRDNRVECGIIAMIFGAVGLHKFYRGQYGRGLLCIVFCWTFIPAIVGVLEGIHYLTETDEQYREELAPKPKKPRKSKEKKEKAKTEAKA